MVPRFYVPSLSRDVESIVLPPDEASHALRVLRVSPGDDVRVFDGRGLERLATVARTTKSVAELSLGDTVSAAPETRTRLTLGQALLKADKFDAVVRDATMLGVAAIHPLQSAHADVPASASRDGGRVERWRRIAVSSAKQCGRAVVPDIQPVADLAVTLADDVSAVRIILAEPAVSDRAAHADSLLARLGARPRSVLVLVGPEGGWDGREVALALSHGCHLLTLGQRTLRADAAPLVALSVLLHLLGDL